jgi:hypothetical protein
MSILDLDPQSFANALNELGITGVERDRLVQQYREHNSPFASAYRALDQGTKDRAEQGLRRGAVAPMSWPEGMTGAEALMAGEASLDWPSLPGDIARSLLGAVDTPAAGLSGVPLSEEQLEEAALAGAEIFVPTTAGARVAARQVDAAQRAQAQRFTDENYNPTFPGEPFVDKQFFHPNLGERIFSLGPSASPTEQRLAANRAKAQSLLLAGRKPAEVAETTGVLSLPNRSYEGQGNSELRVSAVSPTEMIELRPDRAQDYNIQQIFDPNLPAGEALFFDGKTPSKYGNAPVIVHSTHSTPEKVAEVQRHEMTHADLDKGDVDRLQVGTNITYARYARNEALDDLTRRIRATKDPAKRADLKKARSELRKLTPAELYHLNPGEMLARLSQGSPVTAKSLSVMEILNPYIVERSLPDRLTEAAKQALFSERHPSLADLSVSRSGVQWRDRPVVQWKKPDPGEKRLAPEPFDVLYGVPMDLDKARTPFRDGGEVSLFSTDPAARRAWLNQLDSRIERYIPPELRPLLGLAAEITPSRTLERGALASEALLDPETESWDRLGAAGDLLSETVGVAAFPVALGRLGRPGSEVAQELLMGMSVSPAARQLDEALPATQRQELAPPPQQLEIPPAQTDPDLLRRIDAVFRGETPAFGPEAMADYDAYLNLRDAIRRGEYDDVLSEDQLRASLKDLMDNQAGWEVFGSSEEAALIRPRMEALGQRFPDVEPTPLDQVPFNGNQLPDPDWIGGPPDPAPLDTEAFFAGNPGLGWGSFVGAPLPDTAPAFRVPDANPYNSSELRGDRYVEVTQNPLTWRDQGIAGLYSTGARAAGGLKQPTYSNLTNLRAELEARGAKPTELNWQMQALQEAFDASGGRLTREQAQEALKNAPGLQLTRTTEYADYGPPGGQSFTSTVFTHPSVTKGPSVAFDHFGDSIYASKKPPLFHTRAAQYEITDPTGAPARSHHMLEVQSDWAQHRQRLPETPPPPLAPDEVAELKALENMPGALSLAQEERYQELLTQSHHHVLGQTRQLFDQNYPAPFMKNENDWIDAGVRQHLVDAVNSGSEWITFGNGRQAAQKPPHGVNMPEKAAKRFYDQQVPASVERVLKKFARDAGIDPPKLVDVPFVDGDTVRGFQITPELRQALIERGLPAFRDGGEVSVGPGALAPLARAETIEPYEPTLRDRLRVGLGSLLGQPMAGKLAGSDDGLGLVDLTPVGIPLAIQEGTRTAVRGIANADPLTAALGMGEALLAATPLRGPATPTVKAMAAGGRGRGGSKDTDYRFERVYDPVTGKPKTQISPRMSGAQERTTAETMARQSKAAPPAGLEKRLAAAESVLPVEFPRVRLPLSQGKELPPGQRQATYDKELGRAVPTGRSAGPARRLSPEDLEGDAGKEWVQVPREVLDRLGINPDIGDLKDPRTRLSPDGRTVYLGPDDVPRFQGAWTQGAKLAGLPPKPTLLPPRVLPDTDILKYPEAPAGVRRATWQEAQDQARKAAQAQKSAPDQPRKSPWFPRKDDTP